MNQYYKSILFKHYNMKYEKAKATYFPRHILFFRKRNLLVVSSSGKDLERNLIAQKYDAVETDNSIIETVFPWEKSDRIPDLEGFGWLRLKK